MSLMDDAARTVYRVRGVEVLDGRDIVLSFDVPAARTEARVIVQPVTGREDSNGNRDATLAQYSVTDQDSAPGFWRDTDRVEMDGVQYQIEGHVQEWPEPIPHAYLLINRWEG
jgi:hypothetical protein